MLEQWVNQIYLNCRENNVAFFFKQLGSVWANQVGTKDNKGSNWFDLPASLRVREYPESSMATA
jgi:protein gp37